MMHKLKYFLANAFSFVPDCIALRIYYYVKLHRVLNLKHPKRFTEYIQLYKMNYRNENMLRCTDKFRVREFVAERLETNKYLNVLFQVCDNASEISFSELPNAFVIKTTDGGNGDNVFICKNKSNLNIPSVQKLIGSWQHKHYENLGREWAYKGAVKSQIIVEKLLSDPSNKDDSIDDYKFMCYDGKFKYLWVDKNRYSDHRRGFWNEKLEFLPNVKSDHPTFQTPPNLPENIHEMITISEKLSHGFPFVRVDLYNLNGVIIFGEITFYPWSGFIRFTPDSFDYELGKYFKTTLKP